LSDRLDYDRWAAKGSTTLQQRANQKVREMIETHRAERLPEDVLESVRAIVNR